MKIKLNNERLVKGRDALEQVSQMRLPIKTSYYIAKNKDRIDAALRIYDKERIKLFNQYAEKDEKGGFKADMAGQIVFKEGCKQTWDKDFKELLAIENEIDILQFKFEDLGNSPFTPAELQAIEYMIAEEKK